MEFLILFLGLGILIYLISLIKYGEHKAEKGSVMKEPKTYFCPIVGESNYQRAIRTIDPGDDVVIVRERDNPYDDKALCVRTVADDTIGYIGRDSWLRDAVIDEGQGCKAWVDDIAAERGAPKGVRLGLVLIEGPIEERAYKPR